MIHKIIQRVQSVRLASAAVRRIFEAMSKDFDLILCENDYSYQLGLWYKAHRPGTLVIWIMNNPPFFHSKKSSYIADILSRCAARFERWRAARFAAGIDWVVVYDDTSRRIAAVLGRPVKVIPNPIDTDLFFAPVREKIDRTKQIQLLSIGALSPQRRFEDAVSAVALLRKKGYDAKALIICKDFYGDVAYRKKFEAHIRDSGIAEHVTAMLEGAPDEMYLAAIKESHIFVLPNDIKIWGVGAFEAMAAGLPLIVSRITAVADFLSDGREALFVDVHRPDQIAGHAEHLIESKDLYKNIARAGQNRVVQEMGVGSFMGSLLHLPKGL
jgi:glycosyltransferase involved in cell wall biosynthesis